MKVIGNKAIILPDKLEEKTQSGLILTEEGQKQHQKNAMFGTIVHSNVHDLKSGDRVVFSRYFGTPFKFKQDGQDYLLMDEKDILAVCDEY